MRARSITAVGLVLVLGSTPVLAHEEASRTEQAGYIAGAGDLHVRCTPEVNVGGACFNLTGFEHEATVRIEDEGFEQTSGFWKVTNGAGYTYASGSFCGEATFTLPGLDVDFAASTLFVFVEEARGPLTCDRPAGAVSGEIVVSFSGEDGT